MKKNKKEINSRNLIFNIFFWTVLVIISAIWITDFKQVQNGEEPKFCIIKKTHKFEDGSIEECIGLGYKVYDYNRESINSTRQFSTFYIKMQENE